MGMTLIVGWYGMKNTGDDALLAVSCWGARNLLKAKSIAVTARTESLLPTGMKIKKIQCDKQLFKGQNRLNRYLYASLSSHILFGGGSVFQTEHDIREKIALMRLSGKRSHQAIGIGLGPFENTSAERLCGEALKRMDFVGVRDTTSMDIATSLAPDTRILKTFDLAPLIFDAFDINPTCIKKNNKKKLLGVCLCPYESIYGGKCNIEEARLEKLIHAVRNVDSALYDEIVLIDFNGHEKYGDTKIHLSFREKLARFFKVRHVPYSHDISKQLNEIGQLKTIVAMRLHASVFAYLTDVPIVMISYHPKCRNWAKEIGLSRDQILDSVNFCQDRLKALIENGLRGVLLAPTLSVKEAKYMAMLNWQGAMLT